MSYLREDIEKTNLDIPEGEIEIVAAADPVYANTIEVHEKKKEDTEKVMAEKEKEVKDGVLGIKGKTTAYPKTKDLKKMKLSEKLFEDYEDSDWKSVDKDLEKDLWTSIYNELNGDIKRLDARTRRFAKKPSERYSENDLSTSGDIITVYADENERLDFAREVAEEYGVEYKVTEHTSRYAPAKFSMKIYTSQPVTNESLDDEEPTSYNLPYGWEPADRLGNRFKYSNSNNIIYVSLHNTVADTNHITIIIFIIDRNNPDNAKEIKYTEYVDEPNREWHTVAVNAMLRAKDELKKNITNESLGTVKAFGRKANKKDLNESANGEIYSKVVKHFEYGAPGETVDTICDIVDRAVSNIEDGYDLDEAIGDALDNGLIYHKDNWAIKHYYEDSELAEGTYESLYNDVYSIVSDLVEDNDVDEGLTKAQRINRAAEKTFSTYKNQNKKYADFLRKNGFSDEDINELEKNSGLHGNSLGAKAKEVADKLGPDEWSKLHEATATINNVQNHQGSFASIIEQNIDEIDSLINKGDRDALLNRLQELVDEANLTGKNLERANNYMRGLRSKRDFSSLAVSLYDIKLAAMNKENKVINTSKKSYEELTEDVTITEESDLTDFEFWSGARATVAVMTTEDIRTISNYLGEMYPEGMTPTQINDFFWFEDETIAQLLGYDSFEEYEKRDLEEDIKVSKNGLGSKFKSSISKFFQGKQDFEKALDDGEDFKGAVETAKKKSTERDEEKRLEQQKLSNKRDNRLPTFILKEIISWRDDHGSHMGKGPVRLTKYIEDIRKQGKEHPTIISAAKKMRISPSEYYDMWDKAADTALKYKKTPTAKIKISYK